MSIIELQADTNKGFQIDTSKATILANQVVGFQKSVIQGLRRKREFENRPKGLKIPESATTVSQDCMSRKIRKIQLDLSRDLFLVVVCVRYHDRNQFTENW